MIKIEFEKKKKIQYLLIIIIPILLSAFTHLWNPIGFPTIYIDEGHYMRRAIQVMDGQGPQESIAVYDHPYDHPYFGQIFLASMLKLIGYDTLIENSQENKESIQQFYTIPRILMGILAIMDTFLVFKIGELWMGKKVGFISSIMFAVMPLTWMLRMVLLDSLLLPFLLSSVLLALYTSKRHYKDSKINWILIIISGITLGLAIFTKVPIITFIPLVGWLIYRFNNGIKAASVWLIPVIVIPLIWPIYITYTGNIEEGINGIFYQVVRGERDFNSTLSFIFNVDPILVILGVVGGITLTALKRDLIFILWVIPYVFFIYYLGGIVKYFHFIELIPILTLSAGFIIVTLISKFNLITNGYKRKRTSSILYVVSFTGIGIFGLISTFMLINSNLNETFFEMSAFISKNITDATDDNEKITLVGQHWTRGFSWIPMYIYDKEHYVKDVFPERYLKESLKTDNVLIIVDSQIKRDIFDHSIKGLHLDEIRKIYHESDRIGLFSDNPGKGYDSSQYPFTSMKENKGLGLIEIRSNYDNNNMNKENDDGTKAFAMPAENSTTEVSSNLTFPEQKMPVLTDPNLRVELIASGLNYPTTMAFVGNNDLLVLEKNNGTVKRIVNGNVLDSPVLDINVANKVERGLLGIDVANQTLVNDASNKTYIYLFYTQSTEDGNDECPGATVCNENTNPLGNRVYRYEWVDGNLTNPNLILDLPVGPGADHNGGVTKVGPDGNVYVLVGDGDSCWEDEFCTGTFEESTVNSESSNIDTGSPPDGRGGILRISPIGEPILGGENNKTGLLADHDPLNKYFAYGIRNGFGLAFDPVTGNLWDTENGPGYGDEINLVDPGFNSGWLRVQGWWPVITAEPLPALRGFYGNEMVTIPTNLETFANKGRYSPPELAWNMSVGVTALEFLKGDKLGEQYGKDLFVADYNNDYLYNFDLTEDRTRLDLKDELADRIANNNEELNDVVFGQGFGIITDIREGPDGYLYLLSHIYGNIYRIIPR